MTIRIEVDRLVVRGMSLGHAERRGLVSAVEQAIAERAVSAADGWRDVAVPTVRTAPIVLPAGAGVGTVAAGIAEAATGAIANPVRRRR
jgi:hypothetical protein